MSLFLDILVLFDNLNRFFPNIWLPLILNFDFSRFKFMTFTIAHFSRLSVYFNDFLYLFSLFTENNALI